MPKVVVSLGSILVFVLVLACRRNPGTMSPASAGAATRSEREPGPTQEMGADSIQPTVLVSHLNGRDSVRQRLRQGQLTLAVRSADRPEDALDQAQVVLRPRAPGAGDLIRRAESDDKGLVRFESLPSGRWELEVGRIGFQRVHTTVLVTSGCTERVELYLPMAVIRLDGKPYQLMAPRMTVTTCAPDA